MRKIRIRTNILHYLSGQAAMAVFGVVTSAVLARYMSKSDFGQFTYFIAVATIVLPLLDPGATGYYFRKGSRNRDMTGKYWARAAGLRIYTAPVTALVLLIYFWLTGDGMGWNYILVVAFAIMQSLLLSTDIAFRANEQGRSWAVRRTVYEAANFVMTLAALALFGLTSPTQQLTITLFATFLGAAWAIGTVAKISSLTWRDVWQEITRPVTSAEISALWPFAVNNALNIFYYRATAIFIEQLGTPSELANFRVVFVVMISALYVPKAIIWASSPRIALHDEHAAREKFHKLLQYSADANLFISAIITVGGLLYGERLIGMVFGGKYAHLGLLWYVFDFAIGVFFVQQFCVDLLNNLKRERHVVRTFVVGIVVLTALNLILIPYLGALGAAWARLVAGLVMVPLNLYALIKLVGGQNLHAMNLWRFLMVNLISGVVGFLLLPVNFWISMAVFLIAYIGGGYVLGALPIHLDRLIGAGLGRARN